MPAAKKPTAHRTKKSSPTRSHQPTTKSTHKASRRLTKAKPPTPVFSPNSTTANQSLPMPVAPERVPNRVYAPLIRTTYNSTWLRRLGIAAGVLAVGGIAYIGWTFRQYIPGFTSPSSKTKVAPVTHLSISPTPTPDLSKLDQLPSQLFTEASASAQSTTPLGQASTSAQLASQLQGQTSAELKQKLNQYITNLDTLKVDTKNLRAYRDEVSTLESQGQTETVHRLLVEAVVHAYELTALHQYYSR